MIDFKDKLAVDVDVYYLLYRRFNVDRFGGNRRLWRFRLWSLNWMPVRPIISAITARVKEREVP